MANFFDRMLGRNNRNSGSGAKAKDRLKFVLLHDRIDLPPEKLAEMKEEILAVISKYVHIQRDRVDIALEQRERASQIVAQIPFEKSTEDAEKPADDVTPDESHADAPQSPQAASATNQNPTTPPEASPMDGDDDARIDIDDESVDRDIQ